VKSPGAGKSALSELGLGGRRRLARSGEELVTSSLLSPEQSLPLMLQPAVDDLDPIAWARASLTDIESQLLRHGGILFRGFDLETVESFEEFARVLAPALLNYVEGSSPRLMLSDKVYTSTEYPPEFFVSLHSELSYAHYWPSKILFFCVIEPRQGGETPIADTRKVLAALDPTVRQRFLSRGVKYVRNLHGERGAGLSWQTVFETADRAAVEDYCRAGDISFRWLQDGGLWTSQVRPAAVRHPKTGESVWFNQADQWHPSNLGPEVARGLLARLAESELPINAYHGDGSPLDPGDLDHVRAVFRDTMVSFPWRRGDVLLLDNMLAAHGRAPFSGPRRVAVTMGDPVGLNEVVRIP
jgi:alpha-ketoglutarate-dependent taurine dioxygenase